MAVDPLQKESPDISPLWGKVGNVKATMRSGFGVTRPCEDYVTLLFALHNPQSAPA